MILFVLLLNYGMQTFSIKEVHRQFREVFGMKKALSLLTISALSIGMLSACGPKDSGKKKQVTRRKIMIFSFGKMRKRCWSRAGSEKF